MTPPWLTALEVFTLLMFATAGGLTILMIVGFIREALAHERFIARMRDWTTR
jgi:hypothetical protein